MRARGAARLRTLGALACASLVIGGCEGGDEGVPAPPADGAQGGALAWVLKTPPREVDPLLATSRSDQLITRQVHEPLVEMLAGPYGDVRRLPGLALSYSSSAGDTIWAFTLRSGVRFQDGSPFIAAAVLANGERWRDTAAGQELMPDLFAIDAPRPDLVRFFLNNPDPNFPERLASPRTGIVSPEALSGAKLERRERSGTGPFELREYDADGALVARNVSWWGTERELGPALDQVEFRAVANADERLALLTDGDVQVAEELGPEQIDEARDDPLLELLGAESGAALGVERSVRGISSASQVPSLSGVWLTRVGE